MANERKPLERLVARRQKIHITDGLEQIVERIAAETVECILVEGGGEHDACGFGNHLREFQTIDFRHLNVEENHINTSPGYVLHRLGGAVVFASELHKWNFVHITGEQFHCQRLVVNDCAFQNHGCQFL